MDASTTETLTLLLSLVSAVGVLWLAFDMRALRADVAELRGELRVTRETVNAHVNAPGLHAAR